MTPERSTLDAVTRFRGIDRADPTRADVFTELRNLVPRADGSLLTREPAERLCPAGADITPFAAEFPGWIDNSDGSLWYAGERVTGWSYGIPGAVGRSAAVLGGVAVFFPEKAWFDTRDFSCGSLELSRTGSGASFSVLFQDGTSPAAFAFTNNIEPESPQNGTLWLRRVSYDDDFAVLRYYAATEEWVAQKTLRFRIGFAGAGAGLRDGGAISVSGTAVDGSRVPGFDGSYTLAAVSDNAVTLSGAPSFNLLARVCRAGTHTLTLSSVTLERTAPEISFVCRAGNRLWGAAADGVSVYACADGDPLCWDRRMGDVSDSAEIAVGSPGKFTGAAALGDIPVFFKMSRIIRILGSRPDNFASDERAVPGVSASHSNAVCEADGSLYYLSDAGVFGWSGGRASPVSDRLGDGFAREARSLAVRGAELWIACEEGICVIDLRSGAVSFRDPSPKVIFPFGGAVYYSFSGYLWRVGSADDETEVSGTEEPPAWSLCSGDFPPNSDCGCITRSLCVDMESDGSAPVDLFFGWDGDLRRVGSFVFRGRTRREIALPQRYLETARYAISGSGRFRLNSVGVRASRREEVQSRG